MIVYQDILGKLRDAGWTSYALRKQQLLSESTMTKLRTGQPINLETLDVICRLCACQPADLITWQPDPED